MNGLRKQVYQEEKFQEMVKRGTKAWADVPDATQWVEELRGEPMGKPKEGNIHDPKG